MEVAAADADDDGMHWHFHKAQQCNRTENKNVLDILVRVLDPVPSPVTPSRHQGHFVLQTRKESMGAQQYSVG